VRWKGLIKMKTRGRPKGYVMSETSRIKISDKLRGRSLTEDHRRKIARAMVGNQNRLNHNKRTIVDDLMDDYVDGYADENVGAWIYEHRHELVTSSGVMSEYRLSSMSFIEINVEDINNILVDGLTPETIMDLRPDYNKMMSGFLDGEEEE